MDDLKSANLSQYLASAEELIEEARNGRIFILVDDEDRENEGDLVVPAQFATPQAINFMARHATRPGLPGDDPGAGRAAWAAADEPVERHPSHSTAFTVSIEAREGVTTGISAADRAHTVAMAINTQNGRDDIVTPGHVFPLMAREGGTLVRAGHTEAAVDISRLAGLNPSGVICEIMNDDGTMARLPDLVAFAQHHNLKLGTIADLIAYRRRTERLVRRIAGGRHAACRWRRVEAGGLCQHRRVRRASGSLQGRSGRAWPGADPHAPGRSARRPDRRAALDIVARRDADDRRRGPRRRRAAARDPAERAVAACGQGWRNRRRYLTNCAITASGPRFFWISGCATWCCCRTRGAASSAWKATG